MCNLYNTTTTNEAVGQLFLPISDLTHRLTPQMDVYPDYPAPIGRKDANGDRELARARWERPTLPQFAKGEVDDGVTNICNVKSPHWQRWFGLESRFAVAATSFSEYGPHPYPVMKKKPPHWFALNALGRRRKVRCTPMSSPFLTTVYLANGRGNRHLDECARRTGPANAKTPARGRIDRFAQPKAEEDEPLLL
ncbi:hypothetical protein N8E89_25180 (plasmid) [Phyllobacterium sp. A18/5-2]|uniref:hypothetical protein n=1 Tax=Phyllobacterium sp. A18/5-2 TaxID=2978392 RepID=UPI0021C9F91D|nr:hypothetical protein [Phyllobacterium sp. A18/5-2]UXN66422.1 hypothetical protein N8E89_25180 [Phyllobacterium sp. A18/5-2]